MNKADFRRYVQSFDFKTLFNELGWDRFDNTLPITVKENTFLLKGVAEKKGFVVYECHSPDYGKIPLSQVRKQIERKVTPFHQEHLLIYVDDQQNHQIWQLPQKEENKPRQLHEVSWYKHQEPEMLFQRLKNLFFSLDEEDRITIVDVKARISANFASNTEKVTKKFYAEFKKQHGVFLEFVKGIDDHLKNQQNPNKQWYASLMLNRLMFCYFIQKKGFLDGDIHYLRNKLKTCKEQTGEDHFFSFYRDFLLELFHEGLGKPENRRNTALSVPIGNIPYLNGGLFDVHELERQFEDIQIPDQAFEKIFDFFDKWNWHLDTRIEATGKDINPDVIGYIFEKYINDRAAMGAYYTKEDITDYIGKNTIIPFLFDETERKYKEGLRPDAPIWTLLAESGDTYIYDAVKHGVPKGPDLFSDLPEEIKAGFRPDLEDQIVKEDTSPHLWEIRMPWNKKAPEDIALPTETYRELIERRKRYADILEKIQGGEIHRINDFITYNLNIRQFAQDVLEHIEDPAFIRHFFRALEKVSILDPTCGSGAFLFAALNILEPLYEACLTRMEQYVSEEKGKHRFFEEVLERVDSEKHPNRQYYIYKSIILNNLYGVDIMKEAVEIAKLRLFLKLVATVEVDKRKRNLGLEPLPDIDYNIRAGNSLVGFATEKELLDSIRQREGLYADEKLEKFKEECQLVSQAYSRFQDQQLINDQGSEDFQEAKKELNRRLKRLNESLNEYQAYQYGIEKYEELGGKQALFSDSQKLQQLRPEYVAWEKSHQPFHWFAEFYEVVAKNGGFDVIIGNPPYVRYNPNKIIYKLIEYKTLPCGDLYSFIIERCFSILSGAFGYIIPLSSFSTDGFIFLQELINQESSISFVSNFDKRPGKLFDVEQRVTIVLGESYRGAGSKPNKTFSTNLSKWYSHERYFLFDGIKYNFLLPAFKRNGTYLKLERKIENNIIQKVFDKQRFKEFVEKAGFKFYFKRRSGYFLVVLDFLPGMKTESGENLVSSELKSIHMKDNDSVKISNALFNTSLFWWYFTITSDFRHLNYRELFDFCINLKAINENQKKLIISLNDNLMESIRVNSIDKTNYYKKYGNTIIQTFYHSKSKPLIDRIDTLFSEHYGLTESELDFIINYDIKYRMGKELDAYVEGRLGEEV